MNQKEGDNRRPLKSRRTVLAYKIAKYLSSKKINPNQISVASIGFSLCASLCLILVPRMSHSVWSNISLIMAASFIQCRLLCNLFDGMVAVEGKRQTPSGELFNEIPDRISDISIFVALGYSTIYSPLCYLLGFFAALLAVMTAYVRTLAVTTGAPMSFQGPMAKQHRMATVTIACILSVFFEPSHMEKGTIIYMTLWLLNLGTAVTLIGRTRSAYGFLEKKKHV